jgi:hypothetical protein
MKYIVPALLLVFLLVCSFSYAQITDIPVCDVLKNPESFNGKMVRIKGTVTAGFDEFVVTDSACGKAVNSIWLAYPAGTRAKAGPVAYLHVQLSRNNQASSNDTNRNAVTLDKNKDFKQFDSLLSTPAKGRGNCLGCPRYIVTATLIGRLDGTDKTGLVRDGSGQAIGVSGFGNMNQYTARLVLQSVSDITPQEIDYSKAAALKDDSGQSTGGGDPVAAAHRAAKAFPAGSSAQQIVERAAAAFGKQGEHNGVEVGFGAANEVPNNDSNKGDKDSPDGVLFDSTFDIDRLKGDALGVAISHVGSEIADIRDSQSKKQGLYELEQGAWVTTVLNSVAFGKKSLTVPGAYVLWNSAWPEGDRTKNMNDAIAGYLKDWCKLTK